MPQRLLPGLVIDGFRLEEPLHRGGMAAIWRVTHPQYDPLPMVMKVPLLAYGEGPGAIVGFEVEHMILPRLSGPHVPRFIASAWLEEQPFIVMERLPGASLEPLVHGAPLPAAEIAEIGARIAAALHDLHRQHVIHLDLKPSNVMRREAGEAVLIDFGLSRHDQLPDLLAEEFRLPVGTAPYMAPEQVLGDRGDPRSDLFALGVLLYVFATGKRPFGDPQSRRGLRKRLYKDPTPPRVLNRDVPPWLQEIILRCLEVEPARRHATAAQLAVDLTHPDQVPLTERSWRMNRDPPASVIGRWWTSGLKSPDPKRPLARHLASASIVMAAVDLTPEMEPLADALRDIVRRGLVTEPEARLACVNVLRTKRVGVDFGEDALGRNLHARRLVQLKHWARPLGLPEERITYTVLESPDVARALLDFAARIGVDHIVVGARGSSAVRRLLGSVSAQVVSEARASVTVVRTRGPNGAEEALPEDATVEAFSTEAAS